MARAVLWLAALIWLLPGHALAQRLVLSDTRVVLLEGSDVTFSVGLSTVPTDTVTVTFAVTVHSTGVAATDLTVAPATLTFTTADWGTAQEVTVSKVQRSGLTPDPTRSLTLTASGGGYSGSSTVTIGVVDTESRKLVLSPLEPKVREGGTVKQSLRLPSLPSSTVTVSVTVDNNKLTLDRSSLQFTTSDWDMSKSVLITAGQDTDKNDHSIGIVWIARGGGYNEQRSHHRTAVRVFDDDSPQVVLSTSTLGVAEGGSNTYTVRLATRPTATVTVAITGHSGTDLTLDKTSLTFNPSGPDLWSAPQTVTVSAGEDADARNDIGTLLHTASGGDYAGKTTTLPVTTTDDDFTVSIGGVPAKINSTATFTAAFTFSEDVMGFVAADVTVTGGAKGAFSGSGKSYALAVTPTGSADVVVEVVANSATDGDGNTGPAAVSATAAWDAAAPTVSIGGVPAKINSTAALTVTVAWSEDVTGFVAGDVTVTGGTKGAFAAVNGSSYTLAVTPTGGSNVTVEVAADAATDGINTGPASAVSATAVWDAAAPTVTISGVPPKINSRTALTARFAFSEDVTGFATGDVTVTGGTKGAFAAADGSSYTLAVTPAGGSNVAVTVAADAATDGAGNAGPTAAVSATAVWDAVAPTVSIAGVPPKINSRTPLSVTFGWSEDVSGFAAADVTVTGGAKGAFAAADGSSYTLAVTPAGGSNVAVTVAADAATDGLNTGPTSAVSATATWDAAAPAVSITGVPPKIGSRTVFTATFTFSEDVAEFVAADVTVTGGAKGAFSGNGRSYTLAVTPAGSADAVVTVAADAATDGLNTGPASAVSATATWDAAAPTVGITGVPPKINSRTALTARFAFSEDVTGFATGDVTVTGGTKGAFAAADGSSYTLAVTPTGGADVVVTVAADAATDGINAGPASAVSATAAWDASVPAVGITGVPPKINSRTVFTATFTFSEDVAGFVAADVTVTGGAKGAFSGNGRSYTLAVTPAGSADAVVTVAADAATDGLNTGPASAVSATAVWDAVAPTVSIAGVPPKINSRTPLSVTFGWSEDVSGFAAADVTVTGGAKGAFAAADGSSYTLAVTPAGGSNVAVTVAADAATDGAGNAGPASAVSATATWDAAAPAVSITGVPPKIGSRTVFTATFTFSEDVAEFVAADVTVTGGAKGAFSGNGRSYTLAVTPAGSADAVVTVAADAATDGLNTGPASAVSATATWDAAAPTVGITGVPPKINSRTALTARFAFSEDVTGFATGDVTVTGGTKGAFAAADGSSYTLAVTPTGGADVVVTVAADAATDGINAGPASAVSATAAWDASVPAVGITGVPPKINSRTVFTATFTFSEDVAGFVAADVTVTGGAKGAFSGNGRSYTLAVTPAGSADAVVTVAADAATDGLNTGPASAVSATAVWDAVAPTVSIAGVPPKINSRTPLSVTFGWSEDVSGFAAADVTVTGGAKGAFAAADGSSYTLAVTPAGGSNVAVTVAADAATDGAGNAGPASAVSATATWDAAAPAVSITGVPPKIGSRTVFTATFTFSEDVAEFVAADVTVTGGAKGAFSGNGRSYTLAVTPAGSADAVVTVAADAATDGLNTGPASAVSATATWDAAAPTVGITGVPPKINSRTALTARFAFSEDVTGFATGDVTVTGGTKGAFAAADGSSYTLAVTPTGGADVVVTVAADAATDGINAGPASAVSATAAWDASVPAVGITGVPPKINSRTVFTATFTFSEDVAGFVAADVTVTGGAKGAFSGNGRSYTLAVTPAGSADAVVTVAADAATDGLNTGPASAVSATAVWDAVAPTVSIAGVPPKINSRTPLSVTFGWSEDVSGFAAADVTVTGGAKGAFTAADGSSYTLAVTPAGGSNVAVTVAADAATDGLNTGPTSAVSATATWDAAAPAVSITGVPPKIGSRTVFTATFTFSEDVAEFVAADVTVTGGAKGAFSGNGRSYTLAVTPAGSADAVVTVAADAATDGLNTGPASAVSATAVWDAVAPTVSIAGVPPKINSRTPLSVTFGWSEDVSGFAAADVTVTGGAKGAFAAADGSSYTLAVTPAGGSNVAVTVAADAATDGLNTGPTSAVSATATWDAAAPAVTIGGVPAKIGSTAALGATFTFSEDVAEFVAADVTVTGGAKGAFSGNGRSYTLAVTPAGSADAVVTVAADAATDGLNTGPTSAVSATATWDAAAPTVSITGVPPKIGSTAALGVTFAWSEDVTGFAAADVTVAGGAKGAFTAATASSYTLAVTPTSGSNVTVEVAADAATDGLNTGPTSAVSATATWDAAAPAVTIGGVPAKIGSTAALGVTFAWSEDVTGFAAADVTVTGGAKGAFSAVNGSSYTLAVTPTGAANVVVTVAADAATDGGNTGPASAVSATATWDAAAPAVSISGVPATINSTTAFTATFAWSEDVTGFVAADVTVTGGTKGAFSGSGRSYALAVTPTDGSNVTVEVAADAATDGLNTGPTSAVSATATWDAAAPTVSIGGVPATINSMAALSVTFTWSQDVTGFATGDVAVTGGTKGAFTGSGKSYALAVTPTGSADVVVTVAADAATDGGGNTGPAASVSATAAWDTPPVATLTIGDASATEGDPLTFTATLDRAVSGGLTATPTFADGTATRGIDYTENGAALAFAGAAGETRSFAVATTDDDLVEGDETFTVGLTVSGTTETVAATDTGTGTITDDDTTSPPTVSLSVSPNPVDEGDSVTVMARLSATLPNSMAIPLSLTPGTAEAGDYGATPDITIAGGVTTGTGMIATVQDDDESDEMFMVALGVLSDGLAPGIPSSVEVRIRDRTKGPDPTLTVTVSCVPCAVPLGGSVRLTATAFHADGDLLIWRWSAARGDFSEPVDEPVAIWTAPTDLARDVAQHEIRVDVSDGHGGTASATVEITVTGPETVWYLPPMSDPVRQGFVRVLNHSDVAGAAAVTATDDAGVEYQPLTLELSPRQVAVFNSDDLESGNPDKGLTGATGIGTGGWWLVIESDALDVEALAYLRTSDGFVTGMNAVAPREDSVLEVATFNPGSNVDQVSFLRLVNPTDAEAAATVTGVDDAGLSPGQPVLLTLPAGSACTVDAAQLESGAGLACGAPQEGLGKGTGKWRLTVASDAALVAMSLLSSPTGHLTNLSGKAAEDWDGIWHVELFPAASDPLGRQGFVRITSRANVAGIVTILAHDDSNARYEPLQVRLGTGESAHFNSDDLELGNRAKGLTGSTGSGRGNWRLRMYSGLRVDANAYVRTSDGFLTAMQARGPRAGAVHRVAFFNPGSNRDQVSVLRLVNHSSSDAVASIDGTDDLGLRPGSTVQVLVPATDAVELTAAELESGEADAIMSGALGDGTGKWRLRVESNLIAAVLSLLSSPGGHVTNLSYADERDLGPLPAAILPPPERVTARESGHRELRGRWSAVEGALYDVELTRDGVADEYRALTHAPNTTLTFRWTNLRPGTYAVRVRSVNDERVGGPWRVSDGAALD